MSLINDALKRASKAQKQNPAPPPRTDAPLQPVESFPRESGTPFWLVPGLIVAVILLGGWALWQSVQGGRQQGQRADAVLNPAASAPQTTTPNPAPVANPPAARTIQVNTTLVVRSQPAPSETGRGNEAVAKVGTPTPATSLQTPPPVASAETKPPSVPTPPGTFPPLKVNAIIYRLSKSSAMINGQTVQVGDFLDEVKILKIDRTKITVELNGQTKVLSMATP